MDIGLTWGLGIVVSLITQLVKKYCKTSKFGTYVALVIASLLGSIVYYFVAPTSVFPAIVNILGSAAAFHNLLIRQFEAK